MMRLAACLFAILICAAATAQNPAPVAAPAPAPVVRTSLRPADGIVIGQPVQLDVEVLFPGEMPRPPLVKMGDASGAQIFRFESQATTIRDTIEGQDYVGQSFEFVVVPRRGGTIDLPAAKVTLLDRAGDPVGSAQGQPMRFSATVPPGIDPSGPVLAASRVEVSQSWAPDPASAAFKAGGAITRLIRRRVDGVPAIGMAEFRFAAPDGVRVYVDPPAIDDKVNRGSIEGVRTDKATYVFERPGTYVLPDLSQPWWDTDGKRARSAALPGATITVAASGSAARRDWGAAIWAARWLWIGLAGIVLLATLTGPRLAALLRERRKGYLASASHARKALEEAAGTGEPGATYRALSLWLDRLEPAARAAAETDPDLRRLRAKLDRTLYGQGGGWTRGDGEALARLVGSASMSRPGARVGDHASLPPLNPDGLPEHIAS